MSRFELNQRVVFNDTAPVMLTGKTGIVEGIRFGDDTAYEVAIQDTAPGTMEWLVWVAEYCLSAAQ